MTETYDQEDGNAELWNTIFADGHPDLLKQHRTHRIMPREPRCRMCLVPFKGIGGWWYSRRGKSPSSRNPHYCSACDGFLDAFPGGAEVEMAILFVDIRNSTEFAASADPAQVSARVTAFLDEATKTITDGDGFIMAFYGDCVVAVWPPGFVGPDYAEKALATARALTRMTIDTAGPELEVGVGLHKGPIYIGTVQAAKGLFRDVSVFGATVNVCARLASAAPPRSALVSTALPVKGEPKAHDLKGLPDPVEAVRIG